MRPQNVKAKIFLDGSDIEETKKILDLLGFLDGQTTNPANFAKSPDVAERIKRGDKFDRDEVYAAYKKRVQELSALLPDGAISIEVYADKTTTTEAMFAQGKEMFGWIPNAHIKFPTTAAGLEAAARAIAEGLRVNMTLVFTQAQAAAVYAATKGYFDPIPEEKVGEKIEALFALTESSHNRLTETIQHEKQLTEEIENEIKQILENFFD